MSKITYNIKTLFHRLVPESVHQIFDVGKHFGILLPYKAYGHDTDQCFSILKSTNEFKINERISSLRTQFQRRKVNMDVLPIKWWKLFIEAASLPNEEILERQNILIAILESKDLNRFRFWELMHIYSIATRVGLFQVAYYLREKATNKVIDDMKMDIQINNYTAIKGLAALIERDNYDDFYRHFKSHQSKIHPKFRTLISDFSKIILPLDDRKMMGDLSWSQNERRFYKFIRGKYICVAGPAKTSSLDAEAIENHDVVVRCNYRENLIGLDPETKGTKTDISYILSGQALYLYQQEHFNWPKDLKWTIFRDKALEKKIVTKINKYYSNRGLHQIISESRSIINYNPVLFNGTFNAVPIIVLDLLKNDPLRLKIFHADLMLTVNRVEGYIPDATEKDFKKKISFLESCSKNHDPLTQFYFLKNLHNSGKIKCDERLSEVLSMNPLEYMAALQNIYGDAGRI